MLIRLELDHVREERWNSQFGAYRVWHYRWYRPVKSYNYDLDLEFRDIWAEEIDLNVVGVWVALSYGFVEVTVENRWAGVTMILKSPKWCPENPERETLGGSTDTEANERENFQKESEVLRSSIKEQNKERKVRIHWLWQPLQVW